MGRVNCNDEINKNKIVKGYKKMDEKRYYIQDENGFFVDSMSLCKIGGEWRYKNFDKFANGCRRFISESIAERSLNKLIANNQKAKMNHSFSLIYM